MSFLMAKSVVCYFWSRCLMSYFQWQSLLFAVFGVGV